MLGEMEYINIGICNQIGKFQLFEYLEDLRRLKFKLSMEIDFLTLFIYIIISRMFPCFRTAGSTGQARDWAMGLPGLRVREVPGLLYRVRRR